MSFLSQPISLQSLFGKNRKIGEITVNVVINENTNDTLTITKQPVQQGASITDHSYKEPTTFSTAIYMSDNLTTSLSEVYQSLLDLQNSREPFDVVTPKRVYKSMLMSALSMTTDKNTENILAINASFQEVIIVSISTTTVPRIQQKNAAVTGKTENAGKKSALASLSDGIKSLFGGK